MISVKVLAKQGERFILDNSPAILTAVGATGAVASTLLTGKATAQAVQMIREEEQRRFMLTPDGKTPEEFPTRDKIKFVWKEYVPAAGVLAISVTSIIFANRVSTKRAAAMAAAYSLSEKAYSEYREKVLEKFNANKEQQIRDEIAQDHVNANPPREAQIIFTGNGDVLFLDKPTGRYFQSNVERLRSIQNDLNSEVIEVGHATLGHFYSALGLSGTPMSEEIGWTTDNLLEINFSTTLTADSQPCVVIDYHPKMLRGAAQFRGCDEDPPF